MPISPIGTYSALGKQFIQVNQAKQAAPVDAFEKVVGDAVRALNGTQLEADQAATKLAAGEPIDISEVMISMEKADVSFQMALSVRNKVLEAYQEVMRMQV